MKTPMRFDLLDLRLFLFVLEAASITHGAARAGMALASASERIRLIEECLGAVLLERCRRGVRATPTGPTLVHYAQLVLQQLERMRGIIRVCRGGQGPCAPARQYDRKHGVPPRQPRRLLIAAPQIDIDLEERSSRKIVGAAVANLADIGIGGDEVNPAKELQTFAFAEDRLVPIAPVAAHIVPICPDEAGGRPTGAPGNFRSTDYVLPRSAGSTAQ